MASKSWMVAVTHMFEALTWRPMPTLRNGSNGAPNSFRPDAARLTPPRYALPRSGTVTVVLTEKNEKVGNCTVVPPGQCAVVPPGPCAVVPHCWAIALPVAVIVFFVLGLSFWVGYTIATIQVEPFDEGEDTPAATESATDRTDASA